MILGCFNIFISELLQVLLDKVSEISTNPGVDRDMLPLSFS